MRIPSTPADMTSRRVYPPLEGVTSPTVDTGLAAFYLNRQPQTLRVWASLENGPIRPVRVHGRLAWKVAEIRELLELSK